MIIDVLNEELHISNDVNYLTSKIKSIIGNNYNKNKNFIKNYGKFLLDFDHILFHNDIDVYMDNINITLNIKYYVLENASGSVKNEYLIKFPSTSGNGEYKLTLYLTSDYDKINWQLHSKTIQHEVEHLYQLYKKQRPLLSQKQASEYNKMSKLMSSDDYTEKIIGFTYYYYTRVEKNAIINELYRKIMDLYVPGMKIDISEEIKKFIHFQNINIIKNYINDDKNVDAIERCLSKNGKQLKSYLRIANRMIDEYIKAFGRILYKINKDIDEKTKDLLINFGNRRIIDN